MKVKVKRKYVEALVHSHVINYQQAVPDPRQPENIQMIPNAAPTHAFSLLKDPSGARGISWLEKLRAQPQI